MCQVFFAFGGNEGFGLLGAQLDRTRALHARSRFLGRGRDGEQGMFRGKKRGRGFEKGGCMRGVRRSHMTRDCSRCGWEIDVGK